jgi:glycosyltransferase involved in cell wall biosynthesis
VRVLIGSPAYPPSLGGLERLAEQIAEGLASAGDEVAVVTETPAPEPWRDHVKVIRCPERRQEIDLVEWSEVVLHFNVSLRHLWPVVRVGRPWVVSHQGRYGGGGPRARILGAAKRQVLRLSAASVAASRWIAESLPVETEVIPNAYRDDLFRVLPGVARDRDLLFVGRLVSDKGADLLLSALAVLRDRGSSPRLTLAGEGPEKERLRLRASELRLADRVEIAGAQVGEELVRTMNRHRVLVVPSLWPEPFGIVALEGLACGCRVVVADGGGLPEAIGPSGRTFRSGVAENLARVMAEELSGETEPPAAEVVERHLAAHRGAAIVARYRSVLSRLARRGP